MDVIIFGVHLQFHNTWLKGQWYSHVAYFSVLKIMFPVYIFHFHLLIRSLEQNFPFLNFYYSFCLDENI